MGDQDKEIGAMSDQELVAAIAKGSDSENPDNSANATTPEGTAEAGEKPAEGEATAESEPGNAGQPVAAEAPAVPATRAEFDALTTKLNTLVSETEKLRRDNENLQKLNGHLGNQLGLLRKPPVVLPTDTEMLSEPVASTKKVVEATLNEKEQITQAQAELTRRRSEEVVSVVRDNVPDFSEHIEGMAKILAEHKAPAEFIAMFKSNPVHVIPDAGHLIQLAARAKERKLTEAKDAEIVDLKKQLEAAKKGTTRMASNLKDAAAAGPSITSTTVKTGKSKAEATPDFATMKTEDLKKWLSSHKDVDG